MKPTLDETILRILKEHGPMQKKVLYGYIILKERLEVNDDSLRVYLCNLKRNGKIEYIKASQGKPGFYSAWLGESINQHYKETINELRDFHTAELRKLNGSMAGDEHVPLQPGS